MKQTAVEWLVREINKINVSTEARLFINKLKEQAKAKEKEQMHKCASFWRGKENKIEKPIFEQYYNETFKSVKHNTDIRSMDKLIESNKKFDENNLKGFKYDPNDRSEDTPDITNFFY